MEYALVHSYADDTSTSVSSGSEADVIQMLKSDAAQFLRFTASNYLSANPHKTSLLIIQTGRVQARVSINVGNAKVDESDHHRILGITINDKLSWEDHVFGFEYVMSTR